MLIPVQGIMLPDKGEFMLHVLKQAADRFVEKHSADMLAEFGMLLKCKHPSFAA